MKQHLSYRLKWVAFITMLFIGSFTARASHIVGMDMYYTYLTGSTYKISVVAFGDCGPSSAAAFATLPVSTPIVCIYDGTTYITSVTLSIAAPDSGTDITPVCPGVATQCESTTSTIPGIKKFTYTANYVVPYASASWRFVYTGDMGAAGAVAGRAAAITNIAGGTNTELIDSLNNLEYNSSNPILTVVPTPFFCLNNYDGYNPGAVDTAGDSLVFSLVPGVNGDGVDCIIGSPVTYTTGSGAAPLVVATGTFSINSATGQILFYPNALQRALVVYNIEEYRHDTLLGTCQREMTFLVQTCTEPPPSGILSSASAGALVDSTDFKICSGVGSFSLYMNPTETDLSNTITVTASGLPTGATFTTVNNGTNHPNCTFSWTTTGVTPGTYIFYVTFTDNNCPINGSETRSYTINILPQPTITVAGTESVCLGSSTTLTAGGGSSYVWSPGSGLSCTSCASPTVIPSVTTTYTITATGSNGCTNTATVAVTVNPLPTVTVSPSLTICSGSSTTLAATGGGTYSWTPTTGLSCSTCSSSTAAPASTTAYSVKVTGTDGCFKTVSTTVTVDIPAVSAGPAPSLCAGVTATLNPTGAVSYVWSPGTGLSCTSCTNPVASPTTTTTYSVTGTDAAGCHGASTVVVTRFAPVTVTAPGIAYCSGSSAVATASGATTYAWSPSSGLSCTNCAAPTVTATASATYIVTGTTGSCTGAASVAVTVNPLPAVTASPSSVLICIGTNTPLSSSGAASYSWAPSMGLSCTTCSGPSASPSATTTYSVTGTGTDGCRASAAVTVIVDAPVITAGPSVSLCPIQTTTLTPTGGVSYVWSPATGLSCTSCTDPIANPASTTVYTVTGTDAAGCDASAAVTITRLLTLPISAPSIAICYGLSGTLSATGATTYTWSPGTGLSCTSCTMPTADPDSTITYTVIGSNGICTGTTNVTVTVNPLPTVTATGATVLCVGNPAPMSAGGASTYSWTPPTGLSCTSCSSPAATPPYTTTYVVTGTDANGCQNTNSVTITINPLPAISAGPNVNLCAGAYTATLSPSGGVSYVWSPGMGLSCTSCTSPIAYPVVTTVYTVVGTDANGCVNSDTVRVTRLAAVVVTATPIAICSGASGAVTASGATTYTWSPGSTLSCTNCSSTEASPAATTTYTVAGILGTCTDTSTVTVTVNPLPTVTVSGGGTRCVGSPDILTAAGGVLYSWGPSTGLSCLTCAATEATPATTTVYTVTGFNSFGCPNTATTIVSINPLPVVNASAAAICVGSDTTLTASGAVTYTWSPAIGLSSTNGASVVASPTASITYTITGTNANGCVNTFSDPITVYPIPPAPTVVSPVTYCQNVTASALSATGTDLLWYSTRTETGGSGTDPTPQTTNVGTTVYYVSQTVNGCQGPPDSIMVNVFVNAITAFNFSIKYGCYFDTLDITDNSQYVSQYLWTFGDGSSDTVADPVHYYNAVKDSTTYIIKLIGSVPPCYSDSTSDTITLAPSPIPFVLTNVTPSQTITLGSSVQLNADGGYIYYWTPNDGTLNNPNINNPIATPTKDTTYTVYAMDKNGCLDSASVQIDVTWDNEIVPNAFTPNGDGLNDYFHVLNLKYGKLLEMSIYNRWGQMVFHTTNLDNGWDGTFNGVPQDMDVYNYLIVIGREDGTQKIYKGNLTLIR